MDLPNRSEEVDSFLQKLDHPLKAEVEALREIILGSHAEITENIKWNAPNYRYRGEDRVTFRLAPATDKIQLIFHRGVKVKDSQDFAFTNGSGLLKWVAKDRATITFRNMQEVMTNAPALRDLVRRWLEQNA